MCPLNQALLQESLGAVVRSPWQRETGQEAPTVSLIEASECLLDSESVPHADTVGTSKRGRTLSSLCVSAQDSAGGREAGGSVHQQLQLLHLLHQPRVRLQRSHLPVRLLRRLHPDEQRRGHVEHLSGRGRAFDTVVN